MNQVRNVRLEQIRAALDGLMLRFRLRDETDPAFIAGVTLELAAAALRLNAQTHGIGPDWEAKPSFRQFCVSITALADKMAEEIKDARTGQPPADADDAFNAMLCRLMQQMLNGLTTPLENCQDARSVRNAAFRVAVSAFLSHDWCYHHGRHLNDLPDDEELLADIIRECDKIMCKRLMEFVDANK